MDGCLTESGSVPILKYFMQNPLNSQGNSLANNLCFPCAFSMKSRTGHYSEFKLAKDFHNSIGQYFPDRCDRIL